MLNINGIKKIEDVSECIGCYNYFTDKSIEQNVFITENTEIIGFDEIECEVFTTLNVIHYDENNAMTITFFSETSTDPFSTYIAVKNVFDIYNNNNLEDFLNIMEELCFEYYESAEQLTEQLREEVYTTIKERVDEIKDYIYEEQS